MTSLSAPDRARTATQWTATGASHDTDARRAGADAARQALISDDAKLLVVFSSDAYDLKELLAGVADIARDVPVVGCSTAGEIAGAGPGTGGVVIMALGGSGFSVATAAASADEHGLRGAAAQVAASAARLEARPYKVLLLLSDGLGGDQQEVVRGAHSVLGAEVPLVGGCAGDDLKMQHTFQFHGESVREHSIVGAAIGSEGPIGIGVQHGWRVVGEPMLVTSSIDNRVLTLDDQPALAAYLQRLDAPPAVHTDPEAFTHFAMTHPLGLSRRSGDEVRFVSGADFVEGSLSCIAALPQGSLAWIMEGDRDSVLHATDVACEQALSELDGRPPLGLLAFDCIARKGVLGNNGAVDEVGRIAGFAGGAPVAGLYTYGEIARTRGVSGFHNQTLVVVASRDLVTAPSGWATQQLAGFLAVLTAAADDRAAVADALERLAESFEADAGAFLRNGRVTASLGWAEGCTPQAELAAAAVSERGGIELAGVGHCETVFVPVDRDAGTTLFLARATYRFSAEEVGLLRGMGRVLALGLRLLGTLAVERQQVEENRNLVLSLRERQALLERLARIQRKISSRAPLQDVLNAITAGAAELLGDEVVALRLVDEADPGFMVSASSIGVDSTLHQRVGRLPIDVGVGGRAIVDDRLCVVEAYESWNGAIAAFADAGVRSAMGAPVHLEGRPMGCLVVASERLGRTYSEPQREMLVAFAEHASLALNDARTVQAMNKALELATHQAMHDELTGLPNRACFYDRTDQALRQGTRDGATTAVLLFDLDRFKEINDTLGHKYGDRVLCEIGPRIRRGLRDADTLARLGGDEFCVLLPRVEGLGAALQVAERVIELLEEPFDIDGMTLAIDASCGIAIAPADGNSADLLLQRSDVAMYVAKDSHANVVIYNDDLNVNTPARLALLGELRTAIAQDQLVLHYQPKAALGSGHIQGVEALVRWEHPTLGLIPPDQFIPLAEHTGLIKPLTTWVLTKALSQLRSWQDQTDQPFPADLSMAVNLSTRSLLDDSFPAEVAASLDRFGIPPHLLELEITESGIMADPARAYRLLSELASIGVKLAIDDFGTGYSSLAYLKNLPVDQLKIDQSFVLNMHEDPNDAIIVRSVIDLGHNLGLHTVAEGIEDRDTWDQLAYLGCDSAQGYFLARPMPADQLAAWLQHSAAQAGSLTSRR